MQNQEDVLKYFTDYCQNLDVRHSEDTPYARDLAKMVYELLHQTNDFSEKTVEMLPFLVATCGWAINYNEKCLPEIIADDLPFNKEQYSKNLLEKYFSAMEKNADKFPKISKEWAEARGIESSSQMKCWPLLAISSVTENFPITEEESWPYRDQFLRQRPEFWNDENVMGGKTVDMRAIRLANIFCAKGAGSFAGAFKENGIVITRHHTETDHQMLMMMLDKKGDIKRAFYFNQKSGLDIDHNKSNLYHVRSVNHNKADLSLKDDSMPYLDNLNTSAKLSMIKIRQTMT